MTRVLAAAALALVLAAPARAQTPAATPVRNLSVIGEAPRGAEMAPASRMFEIREGALWLDGRKLPPEAIPQGIDLSGIIVQMELVGPVIPVVEVDGAPFVFESERLVPFAQSSKAGNAVYIMGEEILVPSTSPEERLDPVVNEMYRRQLSEADRALYNQMEREAQLEYEIDELAARARTLAPGQGYDTITTDLRQRLQTLFDLKQEIRAEELDRAESELRALRSVLAERRSMRDQIIDLRLRELLGLEAVER
ncbi:hypothetical protein [Rubricoccus marinus]|uniref:Uncharacterized protein n=1 Tax=Rubricoccus marinus TaxID=716817 RepID=A0A259TWA9_9BACT|nr:hypothetical protein [Rubricoccus marinus]OZC01864.1 hypothetical protein BSZ36_01985 [Rubricoccus marinus]